MYDVVTAHDSRSEKSASYEGLKVDHPNDHMVLRQECHASALYLSLHLSTQGGHRPPHQYALEWTVDLEQVVWFSLSAQVESQ